MIGITPLYLMNEPKIDTRPGPSTLSRLEGKSKDLSLLPVCTEKVCTREKCSPLPCEDDVVIIPGSTLNSLRCGDVSITSLADSGISSLNASHTSEMLTTTELTNSFPPTPTSNRPLARSESARHYDAKFPTSQSQGKTPRMVRSLSTGCPASGRSINGPQVSRLPTVQENEEFFKALRHELESLNSEHSETVRELKSQSQTSLSGESSITSGDHTQSLARCHSDAAVVEKMRKRGHKKGSRSEGDIKVTVWINIQFSNEDCGRERTSSNLLTDSTAQEQHKLPDALLDQQVDCEVLRKLSQELTSWEFPARALGLSEAEIDRLRRDNPRENREQCYKMLMLWMQFRGQKATYRALGRALLSEAKEVYQKFVQFVSNPSHVSEVV